MNLKKIENKINELIFGKSKEITLRQRILILINFLTLVIIFIGTFTNILLDMNVLANTVMFLSFFVVLLFFIISRSSKYYDSSIVPFILVAVPLLGISWFLNGGADGNIAYLIFVFFLASYVVVTPKFRLFVFAIYFILFTCLILISYNFPEFIMHYENEQQRLVDLLAGGLLYLMFQYFIIDIIVKNYTSENDIVKKINEELKSKNDEIAQYLTNFEESTERLSMAMSASKQAWFDLDIATGKIEVSPEYPQLIGYESGEFKSNFQNWINNIHPEDKDSLLQAFQSAMQSGVTTSMEYRRQTKSGDWLWMQSSGKVIEYNSNGKPKRMIGTHMDIHSRKTAEEALQHNKKYNEMLAAALRNINECVSITDDQNNFIFVNDKLLNIYGYTREELIGKNVSILRPDKYEETLLSDIVVGTLDGGWKGELLNKKKDGTVFPIFLSTALFVDSISNTTLFIGSFADITERKNAEANILQNRANLSALIENTTDSIWSINRNYELLYINNIFKSNFENSYGIALEEGMNILNIVPNSMKEYWKTKYDAVFNNERIIFEEKFDFGEIKFFVEIAINPIIVSDKVIGASIFSRDITGRKLAEERLIEQNQQLEMQYEEYMQLNEVLRQTNLNLEIAKEKAIESDNLKTAFLQNISHEIRTPLNTIIGYSKLLNQNNVINADVHEFSENIKISGYRLIETINNVIEISSIETNQVDINKQIFSINALISDLFEIFAITAREKNLTILINCEMIEHQITLNNDEEKIRRVLTNLISNAIKFTDEGSIEFGYKYNENDVEFFVKDTGIGIPKTIFNKIFDRFTQADTSITRGYEGTGLGLSICKGYVNLLGGKIYLESELGVGSKFSFTIPK